MRLHAVGGDIAVEAPKRAEAAVLWLYNGRWFSHGNYRKFKFHKRYGDRLTWLASVKINPRSGYEPEQPNDLDTPWRTNADQILKIRPPEERLQYLYVFANPTDSVGIEGGGRLTMRVMRCLKALADLGIRTIAMSQLPLAEQHRWNRRLGDEGDRTMIEALAMWGRQHPRRVDEVYLVDMRNGFAELVPPTE